MSISIRLERTALFAEIFGAIAIVATLIVLILEVRANTDAVKSQTAQNTFEASFSMMLDLRQDQISAYQKLMSNGPAGLSEAEAVTAEIVLTSAFTTYDSHYYQNRLGNLDAEVQMAYARRFDFLLNNPVVREWWPGAKFQFTESFQDYVDDRLNKANSSGAATASR